jgi:hypothetical protein
VGLHHLKTPPGVNPACLCCRKATSTRALPSWLGGLLKPFTSRPVSDWANLAGHSLAEVLDSITQVVALGVLVMTSVNLNPDPVELASSPAQV